jgi:hypothetical protein
LNPTLLDCQTLWIQMLAKYKCMMEKIREWKWTLSNKSLNNEFKIIIIDWNVYLWEKGSWMLKGRGGF